MMAPGLVTVRVVRGQGEGLACGEGSGVSVSGRGAGWEPKSKWANQELACMRGCGAFRGAKWKGLGDTIYGGAGAPVGRNEGQLPDPS